MASQPVTADDPVDELAGDQRPPPSPDPYAAARTIGPTREVGVEIDRCAAALNRIWEAASGAASELADAEADAGIRTGSAAGTRSHSAAASVAPVRLHEHSTDDGKRLIAIAAPDAPSLRGYNRAIAKRVRRLADRIEDLAADLEADAARRACHDCAAATISGAYHAAHAR